jgi:hypothetical protein
LGDDPVYVAEQLGHAESAFSMEVYAKAVKRRARLSGAYLEQFDAARDWALIGTSAETEAGSPTSRQSSGTQESA